MKILDNNFANVTFEEKIFRVNIKDVYPKEEEWEECKQGLENFYEAIKIKKVHFTILYDITNMGLLPFNYIKDLISILMKHRDTSEELVIASIIIVNNKIVKNVVNSMFAMYPSARPIKFVNSMDEAKDIIEEYSR